MGKLETRNIYPKAINEEAKKDLLAPQEFMRRKIALSLFFQPSIMEASSAIARIDNKGAVKIEDFFENYIQCLAQAEAENSLNPSYSDEEIINEEYVPLTLDGSIIQPSRSQRRANSLEK